MWGPTWGLLDYHEVYLMWKSSKISEFRVSPARLRPKCLFFYCSCFFRTQDRRDETRRGARRERHRPTAPRPANVERGLVDHEEYHEVSRSRPP